MPDKGKQFDLFKPVPQGAPVDYKVVEPPPPVSNDDVPYEPTDADKEWELNLSEGKNGEKPVKLLKPERRGKLPGWKQVALKDAKNNDRP